MAGWRWNVFDVLVVGLQLFEVVGSVATNSQHTDHMDAPNFSMVRVLRLLRLVRVLRIVRVVRLLGDLRLLVMSVMSSLSSLAWTVVFLALVIYTVSLYFTQLVAEHRSAPGPVRESDAVLDKFFGSLGKTMGTLFFSITAGLDWHEAAEPLMTNVSPFAGFIFMTYIAFMVLALLNVVTGVFVESVLKNARSEKDVELINNVRELFTACDDGMETSMTLEMFEGKLEAPEMQDFFRGIDVDISEAQGLFQLLDLDNSGFIRAEEFLDACMCLRGPAKGLDQAMLIQEVRGIHQLLNVAGGST